MAPKLKMCAILRNKVVILYHFLEDESKTCVETTKMESNTMSCNLVLENKKWKLSPILRNTRDILNH